MGHSQADKAHSRERILTEAAAMIRDAGLESVSVARLMRSAGLTHGGFYGHFASRDELLAQALERALLDGAAASRAASRAGGRAGGRSGRGDYEAFVRRYLSRTHRDARQQGCAVAALAADAARADAPVREVMSGHVERFVDRVADLAGTDDDGALFAVSALVGGLLLSRVFTDAQRADAVLQAVRAGLLKAGAGAGASD